MGGLFAFTGYAGWLGWQWRRTRTIGDDIKALKATAPAAAPAAAVAAEGALAAPPSALALQITALEAVSHFVRKIRDRDRDLVLVVVCCSPHRALGALLAHQ